MSEQVLIAVLVVLTGAIGGCFVLILSHMRDCSAWRNRLLVEHGELRAKVENLQNWRDQR